MKRIRMVLALALTFALTAFGLGFAGLETTARAQYRTNDGHVQRIVEQLESNADDFRASFDDALDRGPRDGTAYEDYANQVVAVFEQSLDRLEDYTKGSSELREGDVRAVFNNAQVIEGFMRENRLTPRARRDWARVRTNLGELARMSNVAWVWTTTNTQNPRGERVGLVGNSAERMIAELSREVRHELLSDLPYYGVFDWIEYEVRPDRMVVLRGYVTSPPDTKSRAEAEVLDVEGVRGVVNEIEVLPVSPNDSRLRHALYRAIYDFDSPLYRYGVGSRQAIHIVVKNGRVTLEGVVDSNADRQLAYTRARTVPGTFAVDNQLRVDNGRAY